MNSGNRSDNRGKKSGAKSEEIAGANAEAELIGATQADGETLNESERMYEAFRTEIFDDPADLPIYPTHEFVVFPGSVVCARVTDEKRLQIIERSAQTHESIFIFPFDPVLRNSFDPECLKDVVGTQVRVLSCEKKDGEDGVYVSFFGLRRLSLQNIYIVKDADAEAAGDLFYGNLSLALDIPLSTEGNDRFADSALLRSVRAAVKSMWESQGSRHGMKEITRIIERSNDAGSFCDSVAAAADMPIDVRRQILQAVSVRQRLQILLSVFLAKKQADTVLRDAGQQVREDLEKQQRDYFVRRQIRAMRDKIGDKDPDPTRDEDEIVEKIDKLKASKEVKNYVEKMYKRMGYLPQSSAEYATARTHIETLLDVPWEQSTPDELSLDHAREVLDADHYGLTEVKDRIIEFLAVHALRDDFKAPILCLFGPPGVGKTSIGKSIARALGRKFERISLGGIHDESDIRGHRRTYVASMPGRIVQALRRAQSMNPVLLLDEIDKLSQSNQGDPASALLEVLDPEQHSAFVDSYIETPIDLSRVLFITTANSLDTIPEPLRDRMEILEIPGYTHVDKRAIAKDFLIPKVIKDHGLTNANLSISDEALDDIINYYTREAGVRRLENCLAAACRKAAARAVEAKQKGKRRSCVKVTRKNLQQYLGKQKYDFDLIEEKRRPGISTGLAWTPAGGDILFIETARLPGKGRLSITGKLGDVMQESIRAAMTLARSWLSKHGSEIDFDNEDIHLHVPAGATPKDGPSAGVAIFCALLSLYREMPIPGTIAMTGEISLRGNVLPVGGIREKVLGAHRAGIRKILLPEKNKPDLDDVPQEARKDIKFYFLRSIDDCIDIVFPEHARRRDIS